MSEAGNHPSQSFLKSWGTQPPGLSSMTSSSEASKKHNQGFPCGSGGKESTCNAGDLGLIPGLGTSPGEGKGYPLHYSGLENSMDHIVYGVAKSWT